LKNITGWGPQFTWTAPALARPYVVRFSSAFVNGKTHKLEVRKPPRLRVLAPKTLRAGRALAQ
jgi:hypothetical protein